MKLTHTVSDKLKTGKISVIPGEYTDASVFLLLTEEEDTKIILILRSNYIQSHANEIAFPGGYFEKQDNSSINTAYRETYEEIGISRNNIALLGQLSHRLTLNNVRVIPYVGSVPAEIKTKHKLIEVSDVFRMPLKSLLEQDFNNRNPVQINKKEIKNYFSYKKYIIWGLTGYILCDFLNRCFDCKYPL